MNVPILGVPEQRWECPSCDLQQVTHRSDAHTEFHHCRGLAGLWAPRVAGTDVMALSRPHCSVPVLRK